MTPAALAVLNASVRKYAPLVVLLLLAAGCGSSGSSKSSTTTESAQSQRVDWANSVCAPLAAWESSVKSTASQLKGSPSKGELSTAAKQVQDATKTLANSLQSVGKPPTPAADEAKSTVTGLQSQLSNGADQIKSDVAGVSSASGLATAATSVTATAKTMGSEISSALSKLKSLGPNGEWKQAFSNAQSCKTLKSS